MSNAVAVEIAARLAGLEPSELHYSLHHFLTAAAENITDCRSFAEWTDEKVLALCRAWAALTEWPYIGGAALKGAVWLFHEKRKPIQTSGRPMTSEEAHHAETGQ